MGVMILGLDGMTWEVVEPLMAAGELPTFRALCEGGAHGRLRSTVPPITSSAWSSLLTGKNPGQHGVWAFRRPGLKDGQTTFELVTHFDYEASPLWRLVQRFGRRGAFFNVPCAFPLDVEFSAGIFTSGYLTPTTSHPFTYPPALKSRLLGRYPSFEFKLSRIATGYRELISRGIELVQIKFSIIQELRQEGPWEVLFALIDEPDTLQHALWSAILRREPAVLKFYKALDREIERLRDDLDRTGDTLLIVSDHGFRSVSSTFCVNEALERTGYLRFRQARWPVLLRSTLVDGLRRFPVGHWVIEQYRRGVPGGRIQHVQPLRPSTALRSARAVAVPAGGVCSGVYTETHAPDFIERVYRDLEQVIRQFPDLKLFKATDLYHGPYMGEMPPLVILSEGLTALTTKREGTLSRSLPLVGEHSMDGIIMAAGPRIQPVAGVLMHIYDVLPTVLYLLDLPIPNDLDGRPAVEILRDPGPWPVYDVKTGAVVSSAEAPNPLVQEQLRRFRLRTESVRSPTP